MENLLSHDSFFFNWIFIPMMIFFARIVDVTIGTMRVMFISKGMKVLAPILGFIEVIVWLVAIKQIMENLSNPACYLAYGAGFAMGNYLGIKLEEKLSIGYVLLRVILRFDHSLLMDFLNNNKYGCTIINGEGNREKVNILFTVIKRSDLNKVVAAIEHYNPKAFYSVEDIRKISSGVFPLDENRGFSANFLGRMRKGK
ncbi:MAG: DUF2179 domain-containing protein [Candidatus Delongbacteria bacterium]|nr:DUF2179 domain-containing protein [Candidatus Delongbacteria bacterium]MBN2835157.1 DUF2179 domain-containing protein [Candidatus Delongbacteria bacterium]